MKEVFVGVCFYKSLVEGTFKFDQYVTENIKLTPKTVVLIREAFCTRFIHKLEDEDVIVISENNSLYIYKLVPNDEELIKRTVIMLKKSILNYQKNSLTDKLESITYSLKRVDEMYSELEGE